MNTHYTFCEKCDTKVLINKRKALIEGATCSGCGDRFSPTKFNRICKSAEELLMLGIIGAVIGLIVDLAAIINSSWSMAAIGSSLVGTGLILFVTGQLLHIRAALEKLNSK